LNPSTGKEFEEYFALSGGIHQHYAIVFRVVNSADRLHEDGLSFPTEQRELTITDQEKNAIFLKALQLSNTNFNLLRPYNTFLNSCASTFFAEVLDAALAPFHKTLYSKIRAQLTTKIHLNPANAGAYLTLRGIQWKQIPNMDWTGLVYNGPSDSAVPIKRDEIDQTIKDVHDGVHGSPTHI